MPSPTAAAINNAAVQELLDLVRLYGPNGFLNFDVRNGRSAGSGGPPADLVATLERLQTATVDLTLLADGQTVASVEARTTTDLGAFSGFVFDQLAAAVGAPGNTAAIRASSSRAQYPTLSAINRNGLLLRGDVLDLMVDPDISSYGQAELWHTASAKL